MTLFGGIIKGKSGLNIIIENARRRRVTKAISGQARNSPRLKLDIANVGLEALVGFGISSGVKKGSEFFGFIETPEETCRC